MPDYSAPHSLPSDFVEAAQPAAPQATAILQLDRDTLKWFQEQGPNWQADINDALRSFIEDIQAMDRAAPADPQPNGP
jgi:uncharacterized protein (DUF4415 family)